MPQQQVSPEEFAKQLGGTVTVAAGSASDPAAFAASLGGKTESLEQTIRRIATQEGIDPDLAVSVAKRESGLDPNARGDGGKAVGLFQLHSSAAKDAGISDRSDPIQNVTGGVRYLKQLLDRYQGDTRKALMAYNGGPTAVDAGNPSVAARAYADAVLGPSSGSAPLAPVPSHVAGAAPEPSWGQRMIQAATWPEGNTPSGVGAKVMESFNPLTSQGRINLAGTAAGIAATALTGGADAPVVLPWIARVIGPPTAAAVAGGTQAAIERATGAPVSPLAEGAKQGAYEAGGQLMGWTVRRVVKPILASSVAKQATTALQDFVRTVRDAGHDLITGARTEGRAATTAAEQAASGAVKTARNVAESATAKARETAAARMADVELQNAKELADASAGYAKELASPPSVTGTAEAVKQAVQGAPGLPGPKGPAIRALDLAGQQIDKVAETGPPVNLAPLKAELQRMADRARPAPFFQAPKQTRGVGYLPGGQLPTVRAAASASGGVLDAERAAFAQRFGLDVPAGNPLPGILGQIEQAPNEVSFAQAHQLKRLLDEAVSSWDRTSRKHVEAITKGLRTTLREELGQYAPYDVATRAYAQVVPLYRKGIGKDLIAAAASNPDKIATLLNPKAPAQAMAIRDLLVSQSEKGGGAAVGQRAWDAVRSTFTYENLVKGGPEKLAARVQALVLQHPEFAKTVYGDEAGQIVLSNLSKIGTAYTAAEARAAELIASAKSAGAADVASASARGRAGVTEAREVGQAVKKSTRTEAAQRLMQAHRAARTATESAEGAMERLKRSSIAPFSTATMESEGANVVRAVALGPTSVWGGLSIIRLLKSPKAPDILEWAALSSERTQTLTRILLGQGNDRVAANFIRDAIAAVTPVKPMASHKDEGR